MTKRQTRISLIIAITLVFSMTGLGQSTQFTYQGRLLDNNLPATGLYDVQFRLWDSLAGGTPVGPAQELLAVPVTNGIFSVQLDFGAQFTGAARFMRIDVRPAGPGAYQTLSPRQPIASTPYAIRSLNSTSADTAANSLNLGGVAAGQYVVTTDPRMSDPRSPTAGSGDYVQNRNTVQAATNFNISGNGQLGGFLAANSVRSETQFNIAGNRVLSIPGTDNTFVGERSGFSHSSGTANSFFGRYAGSETTSGSENSFFGANAGLLNTASTNSFFGASAGSANTIGNANSFFGSRAGQANTEGFFNSFFGRFSGNANSSGSENSFFGHQAGLNNTTGSQNSFFGRLAGQSNQAGTSNAFFGNSSGVANTGSGNAFFGYQSGSANLSGLGNSFFGLNAGDANTTGGANTAIGSYADVGAVDLSNATAIGFRALAGASNSLVLGAISGINGANSDTNVGIGTTTPGARLQVVGGADAEPASGGFIVTGSTTGLNVAIDNNEIMARSNGAVSTLLLNADGGDVTLVQTGTGNVGIGLLTPADKLHVDGIIRVATLGAAGATSVCRNASNQLATCSSSLRYKSNIAPFNRSISLISRLKPITFDWRDGGMRDLGLGAEDVAAIEPLLVTYNAKGEVEGVKYDRIGVVLINAVKEQQQVIERQNERIDALVRLVCATNKDAEICKEN